MSLVLSLTPQNNNATQSTPLFQNWGPLPAITSYNYASSINSYPTPVAITLRIREIINLLATEDYTDFRLLAQQFYTPQVTLPWLNPDCYTAQGYPNTLDDFNSYPGVMNFDFTPAFQNLELLETGVYKFNHQFFIQGLHISGTWETLASHIHETVLTVVNDAMFYPTFLNFFHTQGNALPAQVITINRPDFIFTGKPNFILSSATPGVNINTELTADGEIYIASGTGEAQITVTLGDFYDTQPSYTAAELVSTIDVFSNDVQIGVIPINVDVATTAILEVSPISLVFSAIKAILEPTEQYLRVRASNAPYDVVCSPWLTYYFDTREVNGVMLPVLVVVPIPTANMEVGLYNGFVTISDTVAGDFVEITVRVNYNLQGFIINPYNQNEHAFTLDPKFFQFSTELPDTYFQIDSTIKTFEFFTNIEKQHTIAEKLPIFNGLGKLNFGASIHRLMNNFPTINENQFQYKPALFSMNVKEIAVSTGATIREAFIQNISFVAGLSRAVRSGCAFLEFNTNADRVTNNSFYYLNILVPNGNYGLRIFKNGVLIDTSPLPFANGNIIFKKITFEQFQVGDVLQHEIINLSDTDDLQRPSKTFFVIPAGRYSNHIIWENEYLLQSAFEFTGGLLVKSDFENRTQNLYKNLVEVQEILENVKISKLTISTGWIINHSVDTIESLMRAKRVWLTAGERTISLRPISKAMTNQDSERELIEYTIEFQINRNYNEETYSL